MAALAGELGCELCGTVHGATSCPVLSHDPSQEGPTTGLAHLAHQSLPAWVVVQGEEVAVTQPLAKLTRLGPLLAPHTPHLPPHTSFPLKVSHEGGGHTYLDLSRKWLCNWLSLVPVGSPDHHNLLACQIGDLVYYVARDHIAAGSQLWVWYAPSYQAQLHQELHLLAGGVLTLPPTQASLALAPSLTRIVVGGGQLTFTHHTPGPPLAPLTLPPQEQVGHGGEYEGEPSIQLVVAGAGDPQLDCVVSLTITAAPPAPHHLSPSPPLQTPSTPPKRKYNKRKKSSTGVAVAGARVVRQLSPRALGAWDPRPWSCSYCSRQFSQLIPFATHLKGHLLWLVGRCHVCGQCGASFSRPDLLLRHSQAPHAPLAGRGDEEDVEEEVVKDEVDTEEEEQQEDDPGYPRPRKEMLRIQALPTAVVEGPHSCQICSRTFHRPQYLLRHLRKHTGDFTCQHCLKVFARKEGLEKHACAGSGGEQEEGVDGLSCGVCQRPFLSQTLLDRHLFKHQRTSKCERCGRRYSSVGALQHHMKTCPLVNVSRFFQCGQCGQRTVSAEQLERHARRHRPAQQCPLCHKTYHSHSYLAQHLSLCRQSQRLQQCGRVSCEQCGREYSDATAFRTHHHTHTHPFHCATCHHRFQTRVGYEVHVCREEQACDQCGAVFRSLQGLNRHAAVHGPPPHSCPACHRAYYRKESLERHVCSLAMEEEERGGDVGLQCGVCGARLATKHSLNTHLRTVHEEGGGEGLMCEVCGKVFHRRDVLQTHQAVHAPPSLPCPTCHKLFKTRKTLEVHSLLHLNIKRFSCKYCNKKFHQKVNAWRHERSHQPRGAVRCQYCPALCPSTDHLKAHLLSHTLQPSEASSLDEAVGGDAADQLPLLASSASDPTVFLPSAHPSSIPPHLQLGGAEQEEQEGLGEACIYHEGDEAPPNGTPSLEVLSEEGVVQGVVLLSQQPPTPPC